MKKVGIVTDSVANLPAEIIEEKGIKVIPMKISFGRRTYLEGVDISAGDFYRMVEETEELPVLELPTSGEFCEIFESLQEEGYEGAVCILTSNNIFPSFNAASEARNLMRPFPVVVVDSHTASMSEGFMVMEAIRAAEEGLTIPEVVDRTWKLRSSLRFYGMVGMLHYLVRAKRLGKFSAFMRALLNVKPVITIDPDDGKIKPFTRVKSKEQFYNFSIQQIEKDLSPENNLCAAVLHTDEAEGAKKLYDMLEKRFSGAELYIQELTPGVGYHTGQGFIGISYYRR